MLKVSSLRPQHAKIALIGNHLPRHCGIATFTTDLRAAMAADAPDTECWAVAMNDQPEGYPYPPQVRFEVDQVTLSDYRLAADFLNMNQVDVVYLQHEFGIFGGEQGAHVLELLGGLRMPIVSTLHTTLQEPSDTQLAVLRRVCQLSDRVVVMSQRSGEILREVYQVQAEKIALIPHGIPDLPFVDPNYYKDQFGVEGRKVILTFGLLSPDKGVEHMIDALPVIIRRHPDAVYIVLGATHPHVKRVQGEAYRLSLQQQALSRGVAEYVMFHNRFVELAELCEFIGAADLYVTPYLNREQIVSGTLAYALGAGRAAVSTPYWYAEEMLADGRGRIVPFRDPEALADTASDLLSGEVERHAMRKRAYTHCRQMVWKEVARRYFDIFNEVQRERASRPHPQFQARTLEAAPREMPPIRLDHLIRLTDDVGILQHAKFVLPLRAHGYCTDDNARALIAALMALEAIPEKKTPTRLACTYLAFLRYAFDEQTGRFRNFMRYDRTWLEEVGSDDSHGRAVWGLGEAVGRAPSDGLRGAVLDLFEEAVPAALDLQSPRGWAFALAGIDAYLRSFGGDTRVRRIREELADRLFGLHRRTASDDWPWVEEVVTYANGKIPQALIQSGAALGRDDMLDAGLHSLRWLIEIQRDTEGHFVPIGNDGWYRRGGSRARFDQQPIEALGVIEACQAAFVATRKEEWIFAAESCLDWFLGRNDLGAPLYDDRSGGCCDGLTAQGPNQNQGAESTIAWLLSLLHLHAIHSLQVAAAASQAVEIEPAKGKAGRVR
jgi:glycosyltransferase involved in cell wall biosynthesis